MKCSICNEDNIDDFKPIWTSHNAQPVNDGRCCDFCNTFVVIPTRVDDSVEVDSILMRNRQRIRGVN